MAGKDDQNDDKGTEDTEGTDTDGTGTDDGAQDDEGDGDDWKPPTRADWDKVQTALRKARREARAAKRPAEDKGDSDKGKADADKDKADAVAAEASKWKPRLVRTAARSAFVEAGLVLPKNNPDGALARVVKLLDVDDLEIGDDGEIDGLAEQVEDIKSDFPELFATTRKPGRVDGADKPGDRNGRPKSSAEAIAALLS